MTRLQKDIWYKYEGKVIHITSEQHFTDNSGLCLGDVYAWYGSGSVEIDKFCDTVGSVYHRKSFTRIEKEDIPDWLKDYFLMEEMK